MSSCGNELASEPDIHSSPPMTQSLAGNTGMYSASSASPSGMAPGWDKSIEMLPVDGVVSARPEYPPALARIAPIWPGMSISGIISIPYPAAYVTSADI